MPKSAKIFLVEPNGFWSLDIICALENNGHKVVATAKTPEKAIDCILGFSRQSVNIAIVCGNLTTPSCFQGKDGWEIALAMVDVVPFAKLIDWSPKPNGYGHIHVARGQDDSIANLCEAVTRL